MVEREDNALYSMRMERESSVEKINSSFKRDNCLLTMRFISLATEFSSSKSIWKK